MCFHNDVEVDIRDAKAKFNMKSFFSKYALTIFLENNKIMLLCYESHKFYDIHLFIILCNH